MNFRAQYELVCDSRRVLLEYCSTLTIAHLTQPLDAFNRASVRDLLIHTSNAYVFWIGHFGLGMNHPFATCEDYPSINDVRHRYAEVDKLMAAFIKAYQQNPEQLIAGVVPRLQKEFHLSALQLFTHGITHEFHHKGQILTMSRVLGYTPVDTDIIRL